MKRIISITAAICVLMTMAMGLPVSAADAPWYSGWSFSGGAALENGSVVARSSNSTISMAQTVWAPVGGKYDVEWTMKTSTSNGNGSFQIITGTHRAYFTVGARGLFYHASDYDTNGTIKTVSYDIGDISHTYRMTGSGGDCILYIDGFYMGELDLRPWTESPMIKAHCAGTDKGPMEIVLENVTIHPVSQTEGPGETPVTPVPTEAFTEDFEEGGDYSHWKLDEGCWSIKDGCLTGDNLSDQALKAERPLIFDGDFVFQMRMRIPSRGFSEYMALLWPGMHLRVDFKAAQINFFNTMGMSASETVEIGTDWHEYRYETYDDATRCLVYIDDVLILDGEVDEADQQRSYLYFSLQGASAEASQMQIDYISYEPRRIDIRMQSPLDGAEYLEGEDIALKANVPPEATVPFVEYKINGRTVATGQAPDYQAELKGFRAGNYEMTAEYGEFKPQTVRFKVLPAADGELCIKEQDDGSLSIGATLYDKLKLVDEIEYFLDGVPAAKTTAPPYEAAVAVPPPGRHQITAAARTSAGIKLFETSQSVTTGLSSGRASMSYANEISYTVSGSGGSAAYELKNGNHQVLLTHTPEAVTYLTDTGEERFSPGTGRFVVLTEGPTADVYRNGQFAFSYFLPRTDEVAASVSQAGLLLENVVVSVPEERKSYFVKRNVTEREAIYNIAGMPYIYNLDFVAGKEDGLRLVVNDGYYRTDLTMENGKFYVWTTLDDNTDPYRTCVADVPDSEGDRYYRVETTAGMSRLYADGRWIATFRSVRATGGGSIAVNVTKGDGVSYLAVSDNNDIFLYSDDFRGSGEFTTMDHWHKRNDVSCFVDQENGTMTVDSLGRKDAVVELDAFAGNAVLSADVDIKECGGGFWFILNHNVTNVYTKIGYNVQTKKFEAVNRNENSYVTTDTADGELPIGKTVRMELKIQELKAGKQAALYVDGKPVLTQNPSYYHRGKLGFITDDAFIYLRSVSYRGDTKPALGVSETIHPGNNCSFDLIETDEKLLLTGYTKRYSSTDKGKTWTEEPLRDMDSFNTVRLQSGEVLTMRRRVMGKDEKTGANLLANFFASSKDDGETWTEISMLTPEIKTNVGDKNNSMRQGPSGRIYVTTGESSNEDYGYNRVWYSDDDGRSWMEGRMTLDARELGFTIAECTIMELQSGVTRCYFRSNTGYISYIDSYDRGDTWETSPHATPFLSPANMFNIDYDPVDKGTLYMAWGYDNAGIDARVQFNRSRWAVAKSTDDGETWEFLGTYHENNYLNSTWFMNLNINVARDCFILECYSMDNISYGYSSRKLTVEKSKQKPVKKFERLHMVFEDQIRQMEMVPEEKRDRVMVAHPETGAVLMRGEISKNAACEGYLAVDYAAAYTGASVEAGSDGGLRFQTGERTETFLPDALSAKDGRLFVKTDVFAEKFGLTLAEHDGIQIISPYRQWSRGQVRAFRYAVDLFADEV